MRFSVLGSRLQMLLAPSPVGAFAVAAGEGVESAKALGAVTVSTAVAARAAAATRRRLKMALRMTAASVTYGLVRYGFVMYGFPVRPGG